VLHVAAEVGVEPQRKIYDEWGNFVARADLWVVGTRRVNEYDGEAHRDKERHRADLRRERRLVEIVWQRTFVAGLRTAAGRPEVRRRRG
jgi:chromosome condensin MukBEF MukE localization factor